MTFTEMCGEWIKKNLSVTLKEPLRGKFVGKIFTYQNKQIT